MERRTLKRLVALVVLVVIAGASVVAWQRRSMARAVASAPVASAAATTPSVRVAPNAKVARIVPESTRIRVEVINATKTRGLARHATFYLRDLGFDVVDFSTSRRQQDSTVVLDRTGHPAWAALASKALGGARVESRPDSSRYLDLTILIGGTWRPPAQPFYP